MRALRSPPSDDSYNSIAIHDHTKTKLGDLKNEVALLPSVVWLIIAYFTCQLLFWVDGVCSTATAMML